MELMSEQELFSVCEQVLQTNRTGNRTKPAEGPYPHQWLWDSAFIAIGLRHLDIEKAKAEILSLLRGQWSNGMIPSIIFAEDGSGSKDRLVWGAWRSPFAPEGINTTGLTQPPVIAEAVVKIGEKLSTQERRSWYTDVYDALVNYHEWMYKERCPHDDGLILLIHPWESGFDSLPPWIEELHDHHRPWWVSAVDNKFGRSIIRLFRRDTKHVPPGQRLDSIDAMLYLHAIQRMKRKNWDIDRILSKSDFALEDVTFNSILLRANTHLREIAKHSGHKLPKDLVENMKKTEESLEELWDTGHEQFFSRNAVSHKSVKVPSIATFLPLYAGTISKEKADRLAKLLKDKQSFNGKYPIPTVPFNSSYYSEFRYWQGPSWVNTNWMIADGLERYGHKELASSIRKSTIEMVSLSGPYEYFSAKTGEGAGAQNFSWTAALVIDILR